MKNENGYFIGLDIGTSSVGWATSTEYLELVKKKNKNFWGARILDSGETAEVRRNYRSTRRRYDRRRERVILLQSLFADEILAVDNLFYEKLNKAWISDRDDSREKVGDFIFDKSQKKDKKKYYERFPTIWHLRKYLIENNSEKIDIRYLYLVVHHIIKHRGNFLYTDAEFQETGKTVDMLVERIIEYFEENFDVEIDPKVFVEGIKEVLSDDKLTSALKRDKLKDKFKPHKQISKQLNQLINAILGYNTNFKTLFSMEEDTKGYVKDGFDDEKYIPVLEHLGTFDDLPEVIGQIYSWGVLRKLLPDESNQFISIEMVKMYQSYGVDLKELKQLFTEYLGKKEKNTFFKYSSKSKETTYYDYNISKSKVDLDTLYKAIDKKLKDCDGIKEDARYIRMNRRIEDMSFLKVHNTTDKGAIPHQLHLLELNKIIENQVQFYPFLNDIKNKIVSILKFRIPYYVGPLNPASEFAWIERTDEKIYPWNFDDVVNKEKSEENFITNMISKCSYLVDKYALPLQSIVYQEYVLLNELNTVRINNQRLDIKAKQDVMKQLFKRNNSVTINKMKNWLRTYFGENKSYEITGLSDEKKFNGSMSSWFQFTKIGFDLTIKENLKMVENIILWSTIFSDKNTLKAKIEREYQSLDSQKIKSICALTFKGWGRLSYELLDGIYFILPNGEKVTILERMRVTNQNFMQIINDKENGFAEKLEKLMIETTSDSDLLTQIQELPGSPAIKKGIHQAVLLVDEIKTIMGKDPKKIFIEFAREDGDKKRTISRYKQLDEIYKQLSKENDTLFDEKVYKKLKGFKDQENKLKDNRLFLYFLQNGKCLYSQEEIVWKELNSNDYEIDHIVPRSYTKDNSFNNLALVLRKENQRKKDDLLLSESILIKNKSWWRYLNKSNLMTEKKYMNLTRDNITLNAQKGFINRQLVETRQISKHVKNLLTNLYPETKVQTIKAQFNSDYRKSSELYKLRSVNDYHHAHDAFLSIFLGEFIDRKLPFINNYDPKYKDYYEKQIKTIYEDRKVFNKENKYGLLELIFKNHDKIGWEADIQNSKVEKYLNYKDCFITHKVEERSGEFYNQNLIAASSSKLIEQKEGRQTEVYGGFQGVNTAYFTLVKLKKRVTVVGVPVQVNEQIKQGLTTIKNYIKSINKDYEIIREKVLINTSFKLKGHLFHAKSGSERINGKQLILPKAIHRLIFSAEKGFNYDEKLMDFENYLNIILFKLKKEYAALSGSEQLKKLIEDNLEQLITLSNEKIDVFILESLKYFQVNSVNANFKEIPIGDFNKHSRYGRMTSTSWNEVSDVLDKSITGFYESRVKL